MVTIYIFEKICQILYLIEIKLLKIIFYLIKWFIKGLIEIIITIPKYFIKGLIFIFKEKWKKEKFNKIIFILSIIVYLICIFIISRWIAQNIKLNYLSKDINTSTEIIEKEEENIIDESNKVISNEYVSFNLSNTNFIESDISDLKEKNSDVIGWIEVLGTKINYPFVQTVDNEYYLNHNINKKSTNVGWIFSDYRNDLKNFKRNSIIYAHNLTSGQLFGTLPNVLKDSWLKDSNNHYVKLSTNDANTIWQVISVYSIKPETYYIKTIFTDYDYNEFLYTIKKRSIYDFNYQYSLNDRILTLSTCDNTGKKRVVLHAKLVGIDFK